MSIQPKKELIEEILTKQSSKIDEIVFDWLSNRKYPTLKSLDIDDIVSETNLVHEDVDEALKNIIDTLKDMLNE